MENQETFENRVDLSGLKEGVERIRTEIGKVIVGQQKMVDLILTAILADGHILLEGVPELLKPWPQSLWPKAFQLIFPGCSSRQT